MNGRPRQIPDKQCAHCPALGRPQTWARYRDPNWCCSKRCAAAYVYPRLRARLVAGTRARNRRMAKARVEAAVGRKYGELSVREIELFNRGVKVGYTRGYAKGYKARPGEKAATAA